MSGPERIGPEAFDGVRLRYSGRIAVAFTADWCGFCRTFLPEFARLADRRSADFLVADVSAFSSPLWERFEIETVPTVVVFDQGRIVFRADGVPGVGLRPDQLAEVAAAMDPSRVPNAAREPGSRRGRPSTSSGSKGAEA